MAAFSPCLVTSTRVPTLVAAWAEVVDLTTGDAFCDVAEGSLGWV